MTHPLPNLDAAKAQARALRSDLAAKGREITHSAALELIAHSHGYRDWNAFHVAIGNTQRPPVHVGQIVPGRYLKQPFMAEVTGLRQLSEGRFEITLDLAEPVDVVTFDSFSNFRSKLRKVIGPDGRSVETTSDGVPHLILWG